MKRTCWLFKFYSDQNEKAKNHIKTQSAKININN